MKNFSARKNTYFIKAIQHIILSTSTLVRLILAMDYPEISMNPFCLPYDIQQCRDDLVSFPFVLLVVLYLEEKQCELHSSSE